MVSSVSKRVTKNGDPMGIVQLEDMEGEATVVVFPKTYKEAEGYLYGEVDPETGAQLSDAFVRIKGKLERSDRGDQIIAQEIVPLELNEENNKPKVFEVMVPNSRFSQGNMARLATVLTANPGAIAWRSLSSRWTGACCAPRCLPRSMRARFRCWPRLRPSWVTKAA